MGNALLANLLVALPTALWFALVVFSGVAWVRAPDDAARERVASRLFLGWFLYCVPIHLHGLLPMVRAEEMADMAAHPDVYFGSYPTYCRADPRYCSKNLFVMILQGTTAIVTTPLCAVAAWAHATRRRWRHAFGLIPCAVQAWGTVAFFLEPLYGPTRIPRENLFDFGFAFLFMNSMWLVVPALYMVRVLAREARKDCREGATAD